MIILLILLGLVVISILAIFISLKLPVTETTMSLKCIDCKSCKSYVFCTDNYAKRNYGYVTMFSQRIPTYCYFLKTTLPENDQCKCRVPRSSDPKINEAFILQQQIPHFYCSESVAQETVYISLSGRKYHTIECNQIKGNKYATSVRTACMRGFSPCSKCHPPQ